MIFYDIIVGNFEIQGIKLVKNDNMASIWEYVIKHVFGDCIFFNTSNRSSNHRKQRCHFE